MANIEDRKNDPVLQVDDKYFGNLWADYKNDEDGNAHDWRIEYILLWNNWENENTDLFDCETKKIAEDIEMFIDEIECVEAKLAELTGIPVFNPNLSKKGSDEEPERLEKEDDDDDDDNNDNEENRIIAAAIEHRRGWILKAIAPSNPRSPFGKLPAELLDIILEHCCDPLRDGIGLGVWGVTMRNQGWDDWVEQRIKDLVWEVCDGLADCLFEQWKLLREIMVKKYEATEETMKEWEMLRQAGERPY